MSSYLSCYIVPKRKSDTEKKQHIILTSFSRNSDIYQYFWENINPAYCGMEEKYTTLTKENVKSVIDDFEKDINSYQKRLTEYEKYAGTQPDYIEEIINLKEEIENLVYWKNKTSFILDIVEDISLYDKIEEVCCNID